MLDSSDGQSCELHNKRNCPLVLNSNSQIIIASTNFYEEIKKNLISMGVKNKRVLDGIYF